MIRFGHWKGGGKNWASFDERVTHKYGHIYLPMKWDLDDGVFKNDVCIMYSSSIRFYDIYIEFYVNEKYSYSSSVTFFFCTSPPVYIASIIRVLTKVCCIDIIPFDNGNPAASWTRAISYLFLFLFFSFWLVALLFTELVSPTSIIQIKNVSRKRRRKTISCNPMRTPARHVLQVEICSFFGVVDSVRATRKAGRATKDRVTDKLKEENFISVSKRIRLHSRLQLHY